MREIFVGEHVIKVDNEDYPLLSRIDWNVYKNNNTYYASKGFNFSVIHMQHLVMGIKPVNECLDHINGNGLDNRKHNLRFITKQQNGKNRRKRKNINNDKYIGVNSCGSLTKGTRYKAKTQSDGIVYCLGTFDTAIEAAKAYDAKAIEIHGEYARLNF